MQLQKHKSAQEPRVRDRGANREMGRVSNHQRTAIES